MFDGKFRSTPKVTLRGSSQTVHGASDVVNQNKIRRETRQAQRDIEDATATIQRIMRGLLTRWRLKEQCRARYDSVIADSLQDTVLCTRLLLHFFDARLDHNRLNLLLTLVRERWVEFTAPSNSYRRTNLMLKCIQDAYYQNVNNPTSKTAQNSLHFIERSVSDKSFSGKMLLDLTTRDRVLVPYSRLVGLIDLLGGRAGSLIKLVQILNMKYYSLILNHVVCAGNKNTIQTVDHILEPSNTNLCIKVLDSLDLGFMTEQLTLRFNASFEVFVYFLGKLMSDVNTTNKALHVVFGLLNLYDLPPEPPESEAPDSDSSSDEMSVDRISYRFDCLDNIFQKCEDRSSSLAISNVVYLLIVKFKMSVIQTPPIRCLCFRPNFVQWLWDYITTKQVPSVFSGGSTLSIIKMADNKALTNLEYQEIIPPIAVFSYLFYEYLRSSHDADILDERTFIFTHRELQNICQKCRSLAVHLTYLDLIAVQPHKTLNFRSAFTVNRHIAIPGSVKEPGSFVVLGAEDWLACWSSLTKLTHELYNRDSRIQIIENKADWLARTTLHNIGKDNVGVFIDPMSVPNLSLNTIKELYVLHSLPFIVPFNQRVSTFHHILDEDARIERGGHSAWHPPNSSSVIKASIRRDYIYEDAYAQLTESVAPNLKQRIVVQLINYVGLDEAGVDGGGLFREFLSSFLTEAFNPNRGFFIETDGLLHPNPAAQHLYQDYQKHYFFIGRLLGKAIYEKLLVDIPLASYFLHKLLGGDADINLLRSLDTNMYRNILSLRGYSDATLADLCLFFTVSDNILGEAKTIDLKPNGSAIPVTRANLIEYIHLMADYRLNRQIRVPFRNFAEGFYSVLSPEWLKMFNYSEFQSLISGSTADVDIADLREHTVYHGVYTEEHPTIILFWEVVEGMSSEEHHKLLAFVTSIDRTPLLGFKALTPRFAIHSAGIEDRLPTASTCMNLLKLPEFGESEILEKRLRYVIESGAGFELS